MDWIKKHYDQFALALLALGLLVIAVMLILRTQSFGDSFSAATAPFQPTRTIPPLVEEHIIRARETLKTPPHWTEEDSRSLDPTVPEKRGGLFVSDLYILNKGKLERPETGSNSSDSLTGRPIPNFWFIQCRLPVLEVGVALQDPDKDGFTNEDEWRGSDLANPGAQSTDPTNKDSHPPYHTKLFVKEFIRVPFRLLFKAYNGDPKKPEAMDFQIDTKDLRQPSEFLKIGDTIKNTHFKIKKFESKTQKNPTIGEDTDVSELTMTNTETNTDIVLKLDQVTDSPDYFIDFSYDWPNAATPQVFRVKKLQEFVLKPNVTERYKLVDIKDEKAVIQAPDGKQIEVAKKASYNKK